MKKALLFSTFIVFIISGGIAQKKIQLQVDGFTRFQRMDGLGVNVNTRSWKDKELEPALDLLVDSLQSKIVRVIVETPLEWEAVNDNNDPFTFNRAFYDSLYETPKFTKAWHTIAYLNKKGISDHLILNVMGYLPSWMGGETITPGLEDEYVEMLVSFLHYAKNRKGLKIGILSPTNESDWQKEGPKLNAKRYRDLLSRLIRRMQQLNMGEIMLVGPDPADMNKGVKDYIPELLQDSLIMSKMLRFAVHTYGGYYAPVDSLLKSSKYPKSGYWVTEWNAWRDGLDDGKIGVYDYTFAAQCFHYLLDLVQHGASSALVWEGYDSYYDHHAPSLFSYWGILSYDKQAGTYSPRKHFYAISQASKFMAPGAWRINVKGGTDSIRVVSFYDAFSKKLNIVGINLLKVPVEAAVDLQNLPGVQQLNVFITDSVHNFQKQAAVLVNKKGSFRFTIPAASIFTLQGDAMEQSSKQRAAKRKPEPAGWYAGDVHVHRNCGENTPVYPTDTLPRMMEENDLAVISLLADMGNGEVKDSHADLKKINGADDPISTKGRIVHWDAEWHWDAVFSQFEHQALGGHVVLLGLKEAKQTWEESPYKVLEWARKQGAIGGFCHLQYFDGTIQNELNCCIPIELPVEAALKNIDFVSMDVFGSHSPDNFRAFSTEGALDAYYKLLNCGIRLGLTAGTDFPCNMYEPLGTLLTYSYAGKELTYKNWLQGIRNGRTVISRNGHNEFLDLTIDQQFFTGDEVKSTGDQPHTISVKWESVTEQAGTIQLIQNGRVIQSLSGTAAPGKPLVLKVRRTFPESGWIAARRMGGDEYHVHTSPVYITINNKRFAPVKEDALFFVKWIDNLLLNTSPGGKWHHYFPARLKEVQSRYRTARNYYYQIAQHP